MVASPALSCGLTSSARPGPVTSPVARARSTAAQERLGGNRLDPGSVAFRVTFEERGEASYASDGHVPGRKAEARLVEAGCPSDPTRSALSQRLGNRRRSRASEPGLRLDRPSVDRVDQRLVVTGVLVGVGLGEVGDRAVERVTVAHVGRDRDPVA
jgi:hypothetical protein